MKQRFLLWSTIFSIILLAVLFETTNPTSVGPLGILVVFILMYTSVLGVLTYFFVFISKVVSRFAQTVRTRVPIHPLRPLHAYYYASVVALAPVMVVGMLSVGDTGIIELLLVGLFVVSACVYIKKRLD